MVLRKKVETLGDSLEHSPGHLLRLVRKIERVPLLTHQVQILVHHLPANTRGELGE
jgi:hypothetical protein